MDMTSRGTFNAMNQALVHFVDAYETEDECLDLYPNSAGHEDDIDYMMDQAYTDHRYGTEWLSEVGFRVLEDNWGEGYGG